MRLLYAGQPFCDLVTLKRLLLVADEVAFADRPAVTFNNWGLVGHESQARRILMPDDSVVALSAHAPPSWRDGRLYSQYIEADTGNARFLETFLHGLASDELFANKLLTAEADYGGIRGRDVRAALVAAIPSIERKLLVGEAQPEQFYRCETVDGCRETLKSLLHEASVQVTAAMAVSQQTGFALVSNDPTTCRLLGHRVSDAPYSDKQTRAVSLLSIAVAETVIPDQALAKLTPEDILSYRKATVAAHQAWAIDMDRLAAELATVDVEETEATIQKLLFTEIRPRIAEYRNEMISVRDRMFGDLVKKVATWELPVLSIAYLAQRSWGEAIAAFIGALSPAIPTLVDYLVDVRKIRRTNALAYLIEAVPSGSVPLGDKSGV